MTIPGSGIEVCLRIAPVLKYRSAESSHRAVCAAPQFFLLISFSETRSKECWPRVSAGVGTRRVFGRTPFVQSRSVRALARKSTTTTTLAPKNNLDSQCGATVRPLDAHSREQDLDRLSIQDDNSCVCCVQQQFKAQAIKPSFLSPAPSLSPFFKRRISSRFD
mgnify:CR=1 FL=1